MRINGSDLGKEYSAKGIQERCAVKPENSLNLKQEFSQNNFSSETEQTAFSNSVDLSLIEDLMRPEINQIANEPFEVKRFKKEKSLKQRSV
jgi:hypothetical protein